MKRIIIIGILFVSITYAITTTSNVVVDNKTRLEWQNEGINGTAIADWQESITHCSNLTLEGKEDWRLPNIKELKSLVNYDTAPPAIVSTLGATTGSVAYWSSTTFNANKTFAYTLDFSVGNVLFHQKDSDNDNRSKRMVRCVRDY